MKNNGKVRDVRSLACKIKALNGRVLGTENGLIILISNRQKRNDNICQTFLLEYKCNKIMEF